MPCTNDVIAAPLFQSSLPVVASSAYNTAGLERWARCAAVTRPSSVRYSPLDSANTTPLTIIGATGDVRSRDTQAGSSVAPPAASTTVYATMAPFDTVPFVTGN